MQIGKPYTSKQAREIGEAYFSAGLFSAFLGLLSLPTLRVGLGLGLGFVCLLLRWVLGVGPVGPVIEWGNRGHVLVRGKLCARPLGR
jgi:hypothetical protein